MNIIPSYDVKIKAKSKVTLDGINLDKMECISYKAVNAEDENGKFKDY